MLYTALDFKRKYSNGRKLCARVGVIEVKYPKPEGLTGVFLFNIVAGCIEVNCQKPEGLRVALCYNIPPKLLRI